MKTDFTEVGYNKSCRLWRPNSDMHPSLIAGWKTEARPVAGAAVFATPGEPCRVESVVLALTVWSRFLGLMGSPPLGSGRGLLLAPCASVHTLCMRFELDLIFISRDLRVVRVAPAVPPWRLAWGGREAWGVLEVQAGWFPCQRLAPGIRMTFMQ